MIYWGKGSPEGVVTAIPAALYLQTDGTPPNTSWRKRTGTGNTGWELDQVITATDPLTTGTPHKVQFDASNYFQIAVASDGAATLTAVGAGAEINIVGLNADTIDEASAGSGVTVDGMLIKDGQVFLDTISESTPAAGVTIDGLLLKDGRVQQVGYTGPATPQFASVDLAGFYITEAPRAAGISIDGVSAFEVVAAGAKVDSLDALTPAGAITFLPDVIKAHQINERTTNAGVTIDGMLVKDSEPYVDIILEKSAGAGVTIDSVLLKDGAVAISAITEAAVTQHEAALTILESQITDGSILARLAAAESVSGLWEFAHASGLKTDDIVERSAGAGVTIDSVILKDGFVQVSDSGPATPQLRTSDSSGFFVTEAVTPTVGLSMQGVAVISYAGTASRASTGTIRLANNTDTIVGRNFADAGDVVMLSLDTSDRVSIRNGVVFVSDVALLVDTIDEKSAAAGVTVDGLLIKDGGIATSGVTSGTFADARIAESNVTQHEAALTILESQITDGSILARIAAAESVSGLWSFTHASGLKTNIISERTTGSGVTADSTLLKDGRVQVVDSGPASPQLYTAGGQGPFMTDAVTPAVGLSLGGIAVISYEGSSTRASTGTIRFSNNVDNITGRNFADSADVVMLSLDTSDRVSIRNGVVFVSDVALVVDQIGEKTTGAGVTIDGLLIKDSGIPEVAVTSHEGALAILESQIVDGSILARLAAAETVSGLWSFSHASGLKTDVVSERSAGVGITLDSLLVKDGELVPDAGKRIWWDEGGSAAAILMYDATANELQIAVSQDPPGNPSLRIKDNTGDPGHGDVMVGEGTVIAGTATKGFLYIPSCNTGGAGAPTGVPVEAGAGKVALVYEENDNILYANDGGGWVAV